MSPVPPDLPGASTPPDALPADALAGDLPRSSIPGSYHPPVVAEDGGSPFGSSSPGTAGAVSTDQNGTGQPFDPAVDAGGVGQPVGPGGPIDGPPVARVGAKGRRRRRRKRLLIEWGIVLVVAAVVAVLLRSFVVQAFFVPSPSMVPTLDVGDRILVIKSSLLVGPVGRGSIVVFHHPTFFPCSGGDDNIQDLVKRVIGLPGETIWSVGNTIYINGKPLQDPGWYRGGYPQVGSTPISRTMIPKDYYFVMGDNRTDSCDSRSFGPIAGSSIIGKVELIVWRNGRPYFHAF